MCRGIILSFLSFSLCLAAANDALDATLNRIDKAGSQFKGMEAKFKSTKHTDIVNDNSDSFGVIRIKDINHKILGVLDFQKPDKKTVALNDKTVEIFLPNINTVQVMDLGSHKNLVEQFILFGFGTSRSDLEKAYNVSLGGSETINGEPTTRLELTSKSPEVAQKLSKFELWISDKSGEPVQQKFYEPSHDYTVFTYSDMHLQVPSDNTLKPKYPSNVKREKLNK